MIDHVGEIAALSVSVFWTITAVAFEYAAKRIGSVALNLLRLFVALSVFTVLALVSRGEFLPLGAGASLWGWLSLSGLVGFVIGDLFLFQAFIDIGARTTMVVYASSPLMTAIIGYFLLGERVAPIGVLGMFIVVFGIALVVCGSRSNPDGPASVSSARRFRGLACAFAGALGQSGGLILSKIGAPDYDAFAATQIRVLAGLFGFLIVTAVTRKFGELFRAFSDKKALGMLSVGAFFGPFLGVSLGLFAVQRAPSGVAATLMGLTPIFILVPAIIKKKEQVTILEITGAVAAVAGSAFLFIV